MCQSKELSVVLEAIESVPEVGRVGNYEGVYELGIGFEGYLPRDGAAPQYGSVGEHSRIRSIAITTYISRTADPKILSIAYADPIRGSTLSSKPQNVYSIFRGKSDIAGPARDN
jgi:hypothetical protein